MTDVAAYIGMPLLSNVPFGREDWKLATCPECGVDCWDRNNKIIESLINIGYTKVCTRCMLILGNKGDC